MSPAFVLAVIGALLPLTGLTKVNGGLPSLADTLRFVVGGP